MLVYATLPKVTVTKKGIEKKKEIYVLSLASDTHGESNHRALAVGASNETLKNVSTDIEAAMKFVVMSVSNVFTGITAKQPLSLSGDGIVLYPPNDPKGMLALHFVIVESDHGKRNAGRLLDQVFGDKDVKSLLGEFAKLTAATGNIPVSLLTSLFGAVTSLIPKILAANRDDLLFSHNHSGVEFNSYNASPEGTEFAVGNDKAGAILKLWAR